MESEWIKRVKKIMAEKRITQQDLVPILGLSTRGAVGHYLTGRSKPTLDQFQAMADYFGVSINFILTGDSNEATINKQKLQQCIAAVDNVITKNKLSVDDDQKAKLVAYLYAETPDNEEVTEAQAFDLASIFA